MHRRSIHRTLLRIRDFAQRRTLRIGPEAMRGRVVVLCGLIPLILALSGQAGELHEASRACDIDRVQQLLPKDALLNERDTEGRSPLHVAIDARQVDCVGLLLRAGADRFARDHRGRSSYDAAFQITDIDLRAKILLLVWHSGELGGAQPEGPALGSLEYWAMRGSPGVAEMLLELGANPNEVGTTGSFPLSDASLKGDLRLVRELIGRGARVAAVSKGGMQAIHEAVLGGHADVVRELAKHGADVNAPTRDGAQTPLHIAAVMGRTRAAEVLVSLGANRQSRDANGLTPLLAAERAGQEEVVALLNRPASGPDRRKP